MNFGRKSRNPSNSKLSDEEKRAQVKAEGISSSKKQLIRLLLSNIRRNSEDCLKGKDEEGFSLLQLDTIKYELEYK